MMTEEEAARLGASRVRDGEQLDWERLENHLKEHLPLTGELEAWQFPNGSANLTYLLVADNTRLVLRRPPFGPLPPGAHDMRREHAALSRLWAVFPPAPRSFLFCEDAGVIGASFVVMEFREGIVVWDSVPAALAQHADVGRRLGLAVVDALAGLHTVDVHRAGLADLGRPDGFVERQVSGWRRRWSLASRSSASADSIALMDDVGGLLCESIPQAQAAVLLHNDPKLDNCQFRPALPDRVHSMFDWDMATIGDPLIDLGTLLNYWPDASDDARDRGVYADGLATIGLPSHREVLDRYATLTGFDLSKVTWYVAFAAWKTAVVLQQLYSRYERGDSTDERMAAKREQVDWLALRARRLLAQ